MPDADLAHREGVELVNAGSWRLLSGDWNPNRDDILAAVEAAKCPAVRRPKLKLGHLDTRFNQPIDSSLDGQPSLGWFDNLRASADGNTLIGDQVALPWLSAVQPAAYPDRSVEGTHNARCALGHTHPFVVTAVSLLGETPPGIPTLKSIRSIDDLPAALGVAAAGEDLADGESVQATVSASAEVHTGAMVALIPTAEDAERLAVEGGEGANELHLTLAYLGKAADLGAGGKQDVIDHVSTVCNGLPRLEADIFSVNLFNPGDAQPERDPCLVWGVTGDMVDAVHDLVGETLHLIDAPIPSQHRPWAAHITAAYTGDPALIPELASKVGPVAFDRLRLAFGGEFIDIPLMDWPGEETDVAASADPIAAARERLTTLQRQVKAAEGADAAPAGTPTPPAENPPPDTTPAPQLPAAESEPVTPTKEDPVSLSEDMRSRLGLADDADETAALAAIDALKTAAEKQPEPTPEMVAASAAAKADADKAKADAEAATAEKDELRKEVTVLASQVETMSARIAAADAETAKTVKASVLDTAQREGKFTPADREQWETDYDESPGVTTRTLARIAKGYAVPVMASGTVGDPEPQGTDTAFEADYERHFGADKKASV